MGELWQALGLGIVVPCGVAAVTGFLLRRLTPSDALRRYLLAVPLAAGIVAGYVLLPSWAHLIPQRHWQWLPYAGTAAAVLGGLLPARASSWLARATVCGLLVGVMSLVLVPTWDTLRPARPVWCLGFAIYTFVLMLLADRWTTAATATITVAAVTLGTAAVAILTAACVSLTYGQLMGVMSAAMAGCWLVVRRHRDPLSVRGWLPAACSLLAGSALIGCVEPQEPLWWLLAVPWATLAAVGAWWLAATKDGRDPKAPGDVSLRGGGPA